MPVTWSGEVWRGLFLTAVLVAVALVIEHYTVIAIARVIGPDRQSTERGTGLPARYNYAMGLVTVAGGVLGWAAWAGLLTPWIAATLVAAMCAAGGPDFIIHWLEERREERVREAERAALVAELERLRWMAAEYPQVASELARWRLAGNKRHYTAAMELLEGAAFNLGEIRATAEALQLQAAFLQQVLGGTDGKGEPHRSNRDGAVS